MSKGLLIDDKALDGWKSVLENVIVKNSLDYLDFALNTESALTKLEEKYDVIFLDVRLTEDDHDNSYVDEYSGYKILKKIKGNFLNINFSTPIILLTASNKIWYIDAFKEFGVDSFYIKEHPDYSYNNNFSLSNLRRFQSDYQYFLEKGKDRFEVWELCTGILQKIRSHNYLNSSDSRYDNVRIRIEDKIKLGYAYLFSKQTQLEKEVLNSNNESLSFIIFFSILEEISKGYTEIRDTWDKTYKRNGYWKFRNREYFIEQIESGFKLNYNSRDKKEHTIESEDRYFNGVINLSEQIYSLIYAYSQVDKREKLKELFKDINKYRNTTDYIHSCVSNIFLKKLIGDNDQSECFSYNKKVLELINEILKLK